MSAFPLTSFESSCRIMTVASAMMSAFLQLSVSPIWKFRVANDSINVAGHNAFAEIPVPSVSYRTKQPRQHSPRKPKTTTIITKKKKQKKNPPRPPPEPTFATPSAIMVIPNLLMQYATCPLRRRESTGGDITTTRPKFCRRMCGRHAATHAKVPRALTPCTRSYLLIGVASTFFHHSAPLLQIRKSTLPNSFTVASTILSTSASFRISTFTGSARTPSLRASSATVKIVPGSVGCGVVDLAATTTWQPSEASLRTI
mmetsp:Transcript_13475/g.34262  ORF Transcript_13475/g.34262 Transcript_13475/m.34262 type:complete len:257 (+) Transcript_13475:508-1278(+)